MEGLIRLKLMRVAVENMYVVSTCMCKEMTLQGQVHAAVSHH